VTVTAAPPPDVPLQLQQVPLPRSTGRCAVGDEPELHAVDEDLGDRPVTEADDGEPSVRHSEVNSHHLVNADGRRFPAASASLPSTAAMPAPPPGRRRTLIVDDDASMLRFLEVVLRRAGFEVEPAGSGAQALTRLHHATPDEQPIDVVLLDGMLPDVRGYDLARRLVEHPSTARLPICFLTGAVHGRVSVHAGIACIVKPTIHSEIVATLEALLRSPAGADPAARNDAIDAIEALSLL
jgi:CheY-like chemotaxis protein